MGVGLSIRKFREERELSVPVLADRAGLTKGTLYNIERWDRTPRSDVLQKLAQALGVDSYILLEEVTTTYQWKLPDLGIPDLKWTVRRMPNLEESDREFIVEYAREKIRQNNRRKRQAARENDYDSARALDVSDRVEVMDSPPPGDDQP